MEDLSQQAISAALQGNWQLALDINLNIAQQEGESVELLNRLARAYAELGHTSKARNCAQKVLKMDPFNPIAQRCLNKWETIKNGHKPSSSACLSPGIFLEEPGKTRLVPLVKLADPATLLAFDCGVEVKMIAHKHSLSITSTDGKYLGRLPDDLAIRLNKLAAQGNEYQAHIKSSGNNDIKIFIRETKRAPQIIHIPSFPMEKIQYVAFTAPELVHDQKSLSTKI